MAEFGGETLDRRRDQRQRREERGVPVARDDLRRDRLRHEAELRGDVLLDARVDVGEGADRAQYRAGRDLLARGDEALAVTGEFGPVPGELQPERRRLGVDAVAARDRRRVFVLDGAALERR